MRSEQGSWGSRKPGGPKCAVCGRVWVVESLARNCCAALKEMV